MKAYEAACHFLQTAKASTESDGELSLAHLRVALTAACLISKVYHSSYGEHVNPERGKQAFNTCIFMFRQSCVEDNDMYGRATKILSQLWGLHANDTGQWSRPPTISLKSRLFWSISQDGLNKWREKYAEQTNNGRPKMPPPLKLSMNTSMNGEWIRNENWSKSHTAAWRLGEEEVEGISRRPSAQELRSSNSTQVLVTDEPDFSQSFDGQSVDPTTTDILTGTDSYFMQFDMLFPDGILGATSISTMFE